MGTPLDPLIITPGNDCARCWGDGKPFELPTARFIQMQLFDWNTGAAWLPEYEDELSSIMTLEQQPGFPCTWVGLGDQFGWLLIYHAGFTEFDVALLPLGAVVAFRAAPPIECVKRADNNLTEPPNRILLGGYSEITFGGPSE